MTKIKDDDALWIKILKVGSFVVLSFVLIYESFFHQTECKVWNEAKGIWDHTVSFYCNMHPSSAIKMIGFVIMWLGVTLFTGAWSLVLGYFFQTKGEYWKYVGIGFIASALGYWFTTIGNF